MHGRPVICSDIGGMAEKVTDGVNGLHFQVGDPAGLADTIMRAVDTPGLWEQLQSNIPPVYSMQEHTASLSSLYEELTGTRPRGGACELSRRGWRGPARPPPQDRSRPRLGAGQDRARLAVRPPSFRPPSFRPQAARSEAAPARAAAGPRQRRLSGQRRLAQREPAAGDLRPRRGPGRGRRGGRREGRHEARSVAQPSLPALRAGGALERSDAGDAGVRGRG